MRPCQTHIQATYLQTAGANMLQAESVSTRRDFLVKAALPALLVTPSIAAADSTGKFTSKVCVVLKSCDQSGKTACRSSYVPYTAACMW